MRARLVLMNVDNYTIAFIGLGEAASAIISGWGNNRNKQIKAFDIKLKKNETREEIISRGTELNIVVNLSSEEVIKDADLIFSTVSADQALSVAREVSSYIEKESYFFDLNSCAPSSKQKASQIIESVGGYYVDVAVMAPVHPQKHMVPLLISGDKTSQASFILGGLPMNSRVIDGPVGRASSIKMVRSIMVKGLEALTAECAIAAVEADVLDEVFASLSDGHPHFDIFKHSIYNFERSLTHGKRRAEELREVAKMLDDLHIMNQMSQATAVWQEKIGSIKPNIDYLEIKDKFFDFAKQVSTELRKREKQ